MATFDDYFRSVILMEHGDGGTLAAPVTISNTAYSPLTLTNAGTVGRDAAQLKFGDSSLVFAGLANSYFTVGVAGTCAFPGDFCVEMWVRPSGLGRSIFGNYASASGANAGGMMLRSNGDGTIEFYVSRNTAGEIALSSIGGAGALAVDRWDHLAVSRIGTTVRVFLNGVSIGSGTSSGPMPVTTFPIRIGRADDTGGYSMFWGWMDDIRITDGAGRYTASGFSPGTWTVAFGDDDPLGPPVRAAHLTTPALLLSAAGGANSALTTPSAVLRAYGGANAAPSIPVPALVAQGGSVTPQGVDITTAAALAAAYGGANSALVLPTTVLSAAATSIGIGAATLTTPAATMEVAATAGGSASAALTFGSLLGTYQLVGYSGAVVSVTIGKVTAAATGTSGHVGSVAITLPLFEATATGTVHGLNSAALTIPALQMGATAQAWLLMPSVQLSIIGTATVTATYEAYSVNLQHRARPGAETIDEVTHYTNFPFTQIVRFQGSYFGVGADGLYLLEGTTDYAPATPTVPTKVSWSWRTAISDFDTPQKKTLESAYFGGSFEAATITLHVGEDGTEVHRYCTVRGANIQNYRQLMGRGIKARYFALSAAGIGELSLDDLDFSWAKLARRI